MPTMLNIRAYDEDEGVYRLVGRFDLDKVTTWDCVKEWDGRNHADVHTRDWTTSTSLLRTAGGRWVLETRSNWEGVGTTREFITPDAAREWLLVNGDDDDVAKHFGEDVTAEYGPSVPAVTVTRALSQAYLTVHGLLSDQRKPSAEQLSRLSDQLANALTAVGSSAAQVIEATNPDTKADQ